MNTDYETIEFGNALQWRAWLDSHHSDTNGVWLRMYKKASGIKSVNYAEALDAALCYGWIDGQMKKGDDVSYIQKFTPRRKNSMWSKRNVEYVTRLEAEGLMMPAGLAEVARAKEDGRWEAAYDRPSEMKLPDYFIAELENRPNAQRFYESLDKANKYAIAWRLQTAKTKQTRNRRVGRILAMLESGQKFH